MRTSVLLLASLVFTATASAQDTVEFSGRLEPEARAYVDRTHPEWTHSSMPDARIDMRVFPTDQVDGSVVGELDLRYADVATPSVDATLRELWVRFYEGSFTLTMGKQIHTWGTIQDFGVVDILNPQEFPDLTQDLTNRKIGVWTAKGSYDFGLVQTELYAMPWFTPSELPSQGAFAEAAMPRPLQRALRAEAARASQAGAQARRELDEGRQQLEEGQAQIDEGYAQIAAGQAQLDAAEADIQANLQGTAFLPEPQKSAAEAQLYAALAQIQSQRAALERQAAQLDAQQAGLEAQRLRLDEAEQLFASEGVRRETAWRESLAHPVPVLPTREPRALQLAGRLYFPLSFGDFGIGAARMYDQIGTYRLDRGLVAGDPPRLRVEYPRVAAWTLSGAIPLGEFSLRFEGLYLHTADANGTDPYVRNPTLQSAGQLVWDPTDRWQIRAGILDEQIFALNDDAERADEFSIPSPLGSTLLLLAHHIAHTTVTYRWGAAMHQLTLAYLVSYEEEGHFLAPELDLAVVPGTRLKIGGQVFAGRADERGFGQLKNEDNVYVSLAASF